MCGCGLSMCEWARVPEYINVYTSLNVCDGLVGFVCVCVCDREREGVRKGVGRGFMFLGDVQMHTCK